MSITKIYDFDDHCYNEKDSPHYIKNSPHLLRPGHSAHLQSTHLQGSPLFPQPHSGDDGNDYYQLLSDDDKEVKIALIFGNLQLQ